MKKARVNIYQLCLSLCFAICVCNFAAFAEEEVIKIQDEQPAGEFFGVPVPMDNYRFVKAALVIFGARWGAEPATPQEVENRVWEDLVLSYEAHRRNIIVPQEEIDEEITKLLKAEKVAFDWKKDKVSYEKWVKDRVREPKALFENQLKHLIQLQALRESVRKSFQPQVTQEEAMQEYMDEYNTLEKRVTQKEKFPEVKKSYEEQIKVRKQYEALNDWTRQLKKDADIKVFVRSAEPI
ncbi:MAG: hypothetical protein V1840_00990 [Candidatus Omnitrophota bacterium]